ncbi:porin [Anianabacter salinae]|uniref:porin n=1 Tax=Anianabacter salinae TaxID=2851023 RepID=UPI00225E534E|nr:porin [Anianabacter salinae]MBV0913663.1 porin [Anianabacter salinae]
MKKVLFATTALVGSAGIAAADVAITGSAEMGVYGGAGNFAGVNNPLQFFTDIDVTFTMSGTTDGGLTFGASIDLDESDGAGAVGASPAFAPATQGGETIFVSGSFGTLTMGDTDGAFDWALSEVGIGGTLNDDHTSHPGYNGNAGLDASNGGGYVITPGFEDQIARYDYSFNGFSFAVSAAAVDTVVAAGARTTVIGVGAKYTFSGISAGDITVGAGYQGSGNINIYGASIDAALGSGFRAIANYSRLDGNGVNSAFDYSHYALGLGYTMGAITVSANYGSYNYEAGANSDGYALVANYNLGGGAVLQAGYANGTTRGVAAGNERYSFGMAMSF